MSKYLPPHRIPVLAVCAVILPALFAQNGSAPTTLLTDPNEIMRRSVESDEINWRKTRYYTFIERSETRHMDKDGSVKKVESETFDVTMLDGSPYRRLIKKDDKPLSPKDEGKEQKKLEKSIAERANESEKNRQKRIAEHEKWREKNKRLVREVSNAYTFRLLGTESIDGRQTYILQATPRLDYKPKESRAGFLKNLQGKLWVDQESFAWVKAEADVIDTVSFGWFLVRLAKGARIELDQTFVNGEVWLPRKVWFEGAARVGLIKNFRIQHENTYSNYRKFQTDSRLISTTQVIEEPAASSTPAPAK